MLAASTPDSIWVLLALTAGTGGSLLVIGSAAGVAAMGQVKELTFGYYLKKIIFPSLPISMILSRILFIKTLFLNSL
jgi:Na+/H+ antiporter NhaD/arsenite permease-like protein